MVLSLRMGQSFSELCIGTATYHQQFDPKTGRFLEILMRLPVVMLILIRLLIPCVSWRYRVYVEVVAVILTCSTRDF